MRIRKLKEIPEKVDTMMTFSVFALMLAIAAIMISILSSHGTR